MPLQPSSTYQRTPSTLTVSGLNQRTASQLSHQQQVISDQSFIQSWSAQFLHHATVPTLPQALLPKSTSSSTHNANDTTSSTLSLRLENGSDAYPTHPLSASYVPFWKLLIGFHFLFVAYSSTQNLITTVMGTGAAIYLAILYAFFILSSIALPFLLTAIFNDNAHLSIFFGSIPYAVFIIFCTFGYNIPLIITSCFLGIGSGFVWVAWPSLLVTISRFIAEGDMIQDTQRRLHIRYNSTPQTHASHQITIQSLTDKLLLPNGRLNQQILTAEQLQRLQSSSIRITSMLTSFATACLSFNLVVGSIVAYFFLKFNTTIDPVTKEVHVNGAPLFAFFGLLAVIACFLYFFAYKTVPQAIYAQTNTPLIIEIIEEEAEADTNFTDGDSAGENATMILSSPTTMKSDSFSPSNAPFRNNRNYESAIIGLSPVGEENEDEDTESIHSHVSARKNRQNINTSSLTPQMTPNTPTLFHQFSNLSAIAGIAGPTSLKPTRSFLRTIDGQVISTGVGVTLTSQDYMSTSPIFSSVDFGHQPTALQPSTSFLLRSSSIVQSTNSTPGNQNHSLTPSSSKFFIIGGNNSHLTRQRVNVIGEEDDNTFSADQINTIDGLDLDNLPTAHTSSYSQQACDFGTIPQGEHHHANLRHDDIPIHCAELDPFTIDIAIAPLSDLKQSNLPHHTQKNNLAPIQDIQIILDDDNDQQLTQLPVVHRINPIIGILNTLNLMKLLLTERVIALSLVSWFLQPLPTSLMYSLYTASIVRPILGSANVAIIMGTIALTSMSCSMFVSQSMKTFKHARYVGLMGSCIFTVLLFVILIYRPTFWPYTLDDPSIAWVIIICTCIFSGFGDATTQSGTGAALGILLEGSPLIRSAGFALNSVFKSLGSIFIFTSARLLPFYVVAWTIFIFVIISTVLQLCNLFFHKPVDGDKILLEQGKFVQWSKQLGDNWTWPWQTKQPQQKIDDDRDATLDAL